MKRLALLSVVVVSVTACGSGDGGQAATAQAGDTFCKLAQVAKDDNDELSNLDPTDPAKVKVKLSGAIDSLTAASAKAPKDIEATTKTLLAAEEKLESLLKANDFDFADILDVHVVLYYDGFFDPVLESQIRAALPARAQEKKAKQAD